MNTTIIKLADYRKADDPIIINRINTTPFKTVQQVLYSVISMMIDEAQNQTKRDQLMVLRDMLNKIN